MQPIAVNKKAKHDFFIHEKVEAGVCLTGYEVKSVREGRIVLRDSFVRFYNNEAYLINCHISPYSKIQGFVDLDPVRRRKLLLHRKEINYLMGQATRKGYTIVPTAVYCKKKHIKVEIGVAQGKQQHDKRETIKRRIHEREAEAAIKKHKG